jgi:hypothetical protein
MLLDEKDFNPRVRQPQRRRRPRRPGADDDNLIHEVLGDKKNVVGGLGFEV